MRRRRSLQIFSKLSGFLLVNSALVVHKLQAVVVNKRILMDKIHSIQLILERSKQENKIRFESLKKEFNKNQSNYNNLDEEMMRQMTEMYKLQEERNKRRSIETLARYSWNKKLN